MATKRCVILEDGSQLSLESPKNPAHTNIFRTIALGRSSANTFRQEKPLAKFKPHFSLTSVQGGRKIKVGRVRESQWAWVWWGGRINAVYEVSRERPKGIKVCTFALQVTWSPTCRARSALGRGLLELRGRIHLLGSLSGVGSMVSMWL